MQIFNYKSHEGYFTKGECWISIDPDDRMECIFLLLTIKNFKLLRDYYHALPKEDQLNHKHLRKSHNGFCFTDSDIFGESLQIQNGAEHPEGFLIPLNSVKDNEKMFTFDRIYQSERSDRISKYSKEYCDRVYKYIQRLDSLLIDISENRTSSQTRKG